MGKLDDFIAFLLDAVDRDIYVWGAQGQDATNAFIDAKESAISNRNRVKALLAKRIANGKVGIKAYDCSGLGTYKLLKLGLIKSDMTANGLKGKCTIIDKTALKKGCMTFRVYKTELAAMLNGRHKGDAYHVGYVVDSSLNVVEDMGRDDGVIKRTLNGNGATYWNAFGIPSFFVDEINAPAPIQPIPVIPSPVVDIKYTRILKLASPYMTGNDVKVVQQALTNTGHSVGSIDGVFGKNTQTAVKAYQRDKKLVVDGVVGEKTFNTLFCKTTAPAIKYTRLLKKTSPFMKGDDIKAVQNKLSIIADGIFGSDTEKAVKIFQSKNGLVVDGVVGEKTFAKLFS